MADQNSKLIYRDFPFVNWIFGIPLFILGLILLPNLLHGTSQANSLFTVIILAIGLVLILWGSILIVIADRDSQLLTLSYHSVLKSKKVEIPFADIATIELQMSSGGSTRSGRGGPTYRIVINRKAEKPVPLHSVYTSGASGKEKRVKQLRSIIGVGGAEAGIAGAYHMAQQMAQQVYQSQQESLTGSEAEEKVTDGIHWHLQTKTIGASPFTRWFSSDYRVADGFLFITQKPSGTGKNSILSGLNKMLFHQSLSLYGFSVEDTPNQENADMLEPFDQRFDNDFMAFTGNPDIAKQLLNPWVVVALADWAYRFPLKRIQTNQVMGALAVMFSPLGVYVTSMGTMIPEAVDELAKLGVALVKAQGGSPAKS